MICFSRIFSKPRKNTCELVGTVLKLIILLYHFKYIRSIYIYMFQHSKKSVTILPLFPGVSSASRLEYCSTGIFRVSFFR